MNVYKVFVCANFPFGFDGGMWDLVVLPIVPENCLSIYFSVILTLVLVDNTDLVQSVDAVNEFSTIDHG